MPHLPRNSILRIGPWENTVQHSQNLIHPTALGSTSEGIIYWVAYPLFGALKF